MDSICKTFIRLRIVLPREKKPGTKDHDQKNLWFLLHLISYIITVIAGFCNTLQRLNCFSLLSVICVFHQTKLTLCNLNTERVSRVIMWCFFYFLIVMFLPSVFPRHQICDILSSQKLFFSEIRIVFPIIPQSM